MHAHTHVWGHMHTHTIMHTHTYTLHLSVAPDDYGALTNYTLGPFSNDVRELSVNISIENDNITEDAEVFSASLTLDPAAEVRLGNRVIVSPAVLNVTILDDDGKKLCLHVCTILVDTVLIK